MDGPLEEDELVRRLRVELAPYDPARAEDALEALAEFLVSAYLRRWAQERAGEPDDRVAG